MVNQLNMIHAAINEEIIDVQEKNTNESVNLSRSSYVYGDGSVVFPMRDTSSVVPAGDGSYDHEDCMNINELIGEPQSRVRDADILKVPNANIRILAAYAKMFTDDTNMGSFYGMVIVDGGKKLNPLHPVIASMIMTKEIKLSDTFTIIVYPYASGREHVPHETMVDRYSSKIISLISAIRENRYLPEVRYTPGESFRDTARKALLDGVQRCLIPFREGGSEIREALIPVHLATRGIVYPYYGMIKSWKGSTGGAYMSGNYFPMLSGNVDTYSTSGGSTCVGDLSNYSFTSLYVLSNMNILSLYFHEVLTYEYEDFVCACQLVSAGFLGFAAGTDPIVKDESREEESAPVEESAEENTEERDG